MTMQPIAGFDLYASQKGAGMLGGMAEQEAQREWSNARAAARGYQLAKTGQLQGQAVAEQGKANAFSSIMGSLGSAIGSLASAGIKQAQIGGQSSSGGGSNPGSFSIPSGTFTTPSLDSADTWRDAFQYNRTW